MIENLLDYIEQQNPLHGKKIRSVFGASPEMQAGLSQFFDQYSKYFEQKKFDAKRLSEMYLQLVEEMMHSRKVFMTTGLYPAVDVQAVVDNVYGNSDLTTQRMLGLAISQFLWKHHFILHQFYREMIIKNKNIKNCLEVGCGHGLSILDLLALRPEVETIDVVDISEGSIQIATQLLNAIHCYQNKVQFILSDILTADFKKKYDFITMGEVLEHVTEPEKLLLRLRSILTPEGVLFFSTCINCPTADHVYHFQSVDQVRQMVKDAGLKIIDEIIAPCEDVGPAKLEKFKLDISYAATVTLDQSKT